MSAIAEHGLAPLRQRLPNGTTVLAQQTTTHPAVTVRFGLHAGVMYEPADRSGLSHFVSRVIDRGTERRSADELSEALDTRGVSLSANAGRHLFTLAFTCLAEDLAAMLEVAVEIVRCPAFPEREVETRRGEIVTSIRQDEDSPAAMASERLIEMLYPDHPYGRRLKGTIASLESLGREDLAAFHRARFTPAGMTVVIVGDVEPSRAIDEVWQTVAGWRAPAASIQVPPHVAPATIRHEASVVIPGKPQSDVAYGFTSVTRRDPDYYALVLMNNVLGQYGLGGRLGDSIRERQGMAYYAFSSFDANVAEGALVIRAGVAPQNVARTIRSIDEEVRHLAEEGVTPAELADSKRYLIGSMPRTLETNGGIASFLESAEFFGLGLDFDRRLPGLLDRVMLDEVNAAARRLLDPGRATVVVSGPAAGAEAGESPAA